MSCCTSQATSATHNSELLLFFTLLELALIVLAGRIGGAAAKRFGQTAAVGEIIIGILLGPSLFGLIAPGTFNWVFHSAPPEPLLILSQLGLLLLMFQIGMEFDFAHLTSRANRAAVARVSVACLALPFGSGLLLGYALTAETAAANRLNTALFVATAFSITALPILGRMMIDFNLTRTRIGVVVISSAAVNDVVGWLLLALITTLTVSHFNGAEFVLRIALVLVFVVACTTLVRPLAKRAIRLSNPQGGRMSPNLLGGLLIAILVAAITTYEIGIFGIFGGFMMGVILFDETEVVSAWRNRVGGFVTVFFLPIFFTYTGLRTSIGALHTMSDWETCAAIAAIASISKWLGAYIASRRSGFTHPESVVIGFMMNTRALMELIVINVGFDLGVISQKMFTMLVIMAIVSTVIACPALRHFLSDERELRVSVERAN